MTHDFHDIYVFKDKQFSVGIDRVTGKYYVSFLEVTSNRRAEFEVYFELPGGAPEAFDVDMSDLDTFVAQCRKGLHADLKIDTL